MSTLLGGRLALRERLGAGAMGVVFAADDLALSRRVAVKTLPALDAAELAALKSEFRIRKDLVHPNLVTLYELFVDGDRCCFTMELVADARTFGAALSAAVAGGDEPAARTLLTQLVHGVAAVHDAGIIHRDLKPGNLLVDRDGRVVVLDFGLAVASQRAEGEISGTLAYMAPEVLWGQASVASDWFSVGALVYEAVAGRLPWDPDDIDQRFVRVPADRDLAGRAWPWLVTLAHDLLAVDAGVRPTGATLRTRLPDPKASVPPRLVVPFVGRTSELSTLRDALARARTRGTGVVTLRGPSGAGKSRLVDAFLGEVQARGDVAVLRGACHYTEHLPLAALDPLVDELARLLRSPGFDPLRGSAPPLDAAARLFPVLAAGAPPAYATTLLPTELRRLALDGLRALLRWLSGHVFLVLAIDDAQWGDGESGELLRALLDGDAGATALVLLVCRAGERHGALVDALAGWTPPDGARVELELGPLPPNDVADLLRTIAGVDDHRVDDLSSRAGGSPFLAVELARALVVDGPTLDIDPSALLRRRLAALAPDERHLARLAALAGRPIPRALALDAAGLTEGGFLTALALERGNVLAGFPGDEHHIGVYHDQIRAALLAVLATDETRDLHGALADAFERAPRPEPEQLLVHLLGAGRNARAIDVAVVAADEASARLAFERAAVLLQQALDTGVAGPRRAEICRKQGVAWRNGGIGARAAEAFREAAELAGRENSHELADALWADAAEEMVRHGRTDDGERIFRRLLGVRRISLPQRPGHAMLLGLARRILLWLRGLGTPDDGRALPPEIAARQDLIWKAANSLSLSRFPFSFCLIGQLILEALAYGNRLQLVRTLGSEAAFSAALGGRLARRAQALLARIDALVRPDDHPELRAGRLSFRGLVAWNRGRWGEVVPACDAFCELVRRDLPGRAWDLAVMEVHACSALYHLGDVDALSARVPAALAAAEDRGDRLAVEHLRLGDPGSYLLLRGEPDRARRVLADAERNLSLGPSIETYYYTLLKLRVELHERRHADAWAATERLWPALAAGQIFAVEMARCFLHHLRGRSLLGLLAERPEPRARKRWTRELERSLAILGKTSALTGPALAADLHAARVALAGDPEVARRARTVAREQLERAELLRLARAGPPDLAHEPRDVLR